GVVSLSFVIGYIPKGQEQYSSYIVRPVASTTGNGVTATQAAADSGGTTQTAATGQYIYTFATKAPTDFDATATHRAGIYGNRNLTQWNLGTNFADTTYDFVPAGGNPHP